MSCSCESSNPFSALFKDTTNSLNQRPVDNPVYISKSKLTKFDKLSLLQVAQCIDPIAFQKALEPHFSHTDLNEADLQKLADLWESGEDKQNGFSMERIYGSITPNLKSVNSCSSIKWIE